MRRALVVSLAVAAAGCASAPYAREDASASTRTADETEPKRVAGLHDSVRGDQNGYTDRERPHEAVKEAPSGKTEATPVTGEPTYPKVPEAKASEPAKPERERSFALPGEVAVADRSQRPELPGKSRVAVVFVRRGKLVRRDEALRKLAHELGGDESVKETVALERLDESAPETVSLADLAAAAAKQEADLLVLDVREDDAQASRTTLVVHAKTAAVLAHAKPEREETAPAGDLVARLVVSTASLKQ